VARAKLQKNKNNKLQISTPKKPKKAKTISKILVPLDGSKHSFRALEMAMSISLHYSSSITAIYIIDLPLSLEFAVIDPVGEKIQKRILKAMNAAKLRCQDLHVPFKSIIKHGKVGPDIINTSKKGKFDIIVIGKRGISSTSEIFLGSVSHYVIHHSKIPVFIVK
jgi:nucleotide-binding universal stress UspA family protein